MMRIVHVHKAYPPVVGGIERHIHTLATRQARDGNQVTVLCCNTQARTVVEEREGVRIVRVARLGRLSSMPLGPALPRWLRRLPADVIHVHTPFPLGEWASLAVTDTPVVAGWHSDIVRQRVLGALYAPLQRRFLEHCAAIVVATPHHVESSTRLPAYRDKCRVVHYGIDAADFVARAEAASAWPRPYVLFVGRLVEYKGVEVLLNAWRIVTREVDPPPLLVCVGRGRLKRGLWQQAESLGIADRVAWVDGAGDAELAAWMRDAAVLVLPSVGNNEAFGLVQLEAMACETPVVATRLPTGVSYVNLHGETGLLAEVGDAVTLAGHLVLLLGDSDRRRAMGRAGRERVVEHFSLHGMVRGMEDVYREVIRAAGSSRPTHIERG